MPGVPRRSDWVFPSRRYSASTPSASFPRGSLSPRRGRRQMWGGGDAVFLVCLSSALVPALAPVGLRLAKSARFIYADTALRGPELRMLMGRAVSECLKLRF